MVVGEEGHYLDSGEGSWRSFFLGMKIWERDGTLVTGAWFPSQCAHQKRMHFCQVVGAPQANAKTFLQIRWDWAKNFHQPART